MKRLLIAIAALALSSAAYSQELSGTYLTEEYNTKSVDGMIKVTYTFVNDSLYIDAYPSGCGIASMSIKRTTRDYVAVETIYKEDEPEKVAFVKIYHLEFLPCAWDKHCLAVYRDGIIVDIIRKIP
jgi:hypothetical protein